MKRIKRSIPNTALVLATTTNINDQELCEIAKRYNVDTFRGNENDVLDRFVQAAKYYKITKIIRVCADNPFIDMSSLQQLITAFEMEDLDYLSFETKEKLPVIKTHYGFWAEAVTLKVLKKIKTSTNDVYYTEHVTNYIYEHPELFNLEFLSIPEFIERDDIRLTIDTKTDFETAHDVYKEVISNVDFSIRDVYDLVISKKEWLNSMSNQINEQKK